VPTTFRSIVVGFAAWLLAFGVALLARISPDVIHVWQVGLLALGAVIGFLASVVLGRRFIRDRLERGNAVMAFAFAFFAGIYAPITAIWSNAQFYDWVATQHPTTKSPLLANYIAPAVEHTAGSHYAGAILLIGIGWLIARRVAGRPVSDRPTLGWPELPDIFFGAATWTIGAGAALMFGPAFKSLVQWIAYTCGALLLTLLFRSLRLQWRSLRRAPIRSGLGIPRIVGSITLLCLWLGFPLLGMLSILPKVPKEWMIGLMGVGCVLPWAAFRALRWRRDTTANLDAGDLASFAIRCGFWSDMALELALGGRIIVGIGESVLVKATQVMDPGFSTPFAITVVILKPFYSLFVLPMWMVWLGGFIIAAIAPRSTRASHRIIACAQGGAALSAVNGTLSILFALSLALVTVCLIPVNESLLPQVISYFAPGNWYKLGLFYLVALASLIAGGAVFWATKASIVCGVIWLKDQYVVRKIAAGSAPQIISTKAPPPAPNA